MTRTSDPLAPIEPESARRGRLGLLRHADFRRLWIGDTISQFGTQISALAIPYIATVLIRASAFEVALLGTVEMLPFLLFALPAGAWVDRLRRRPVLIRGDLGRALALGTIPVAWELGVLTIWQLYAVGFVVGVLTVFFDVAYQSYLPALVGRGDLIEGNAKLQASQASAQVIGPGLGGGLIALVGAPVAVIADALSYLASALFVSRIERREPDPRIAAAEAGRPAEPLRAQIAAGLHFVLGNRHLRGIAGATSSSNLFGNMFFAILPVYLYRELGLSAATVGVIFGIGSLGAFGGALVASRIAARAGLGPTIVASILLGSLGPLFVAVAPHGAPIPWLTASVVLGGFGGVVYNVNQVSYRQAICPPEMQGRMNATMRFLVWGTIPIGSVVGGLIASGIGVHGAIWIGAIGGCFAFLPVFLSPVRGLARMPVPVS